MKKLLALLPFVIGTCYGVLEQHDYSHICSTLNPLCHDESTDSFRMVKSDEALTWMPSGHGNLRFPHFVCGSRTATEAIPTSIATRSPLPTPTPDTPPTAETPAIQ
jgi:hypothetical protein